MKNGIPGTLSCKQTVPDEGTSYFTVWWVASATTRISSPRENQFPGEKPDAINLQSVMIGVILYIDFSG